MCELESSGYTSIRVALGLAADDAAGLAAESIEALQYLPDITARVNAALEGAAGGCFSCDDESEDYDEVRAASVKVALVLLTAAAIAGENRAAAKDNRIKDQQLGDLKVSYDETGWGSVAADLLARGLAALARACPEAAALYSEALGYGVAPDFMWKDGPTAGKTTTELAEERAGVFAPWILGGP